MEFAVQQSIRLNSLVMICISSYVLLVIVHNRPEMTDKTVPCFLPDYFNDLIFNSSL